MDDLTAADLFSPSKARQQRAQAQDWAQIDSWLSTIYSGRSIPTFERNDETLKVLRELSTANERADEERAMQERVEREALKELDEVERNDDDARILDLLRTSLTSDGAEALDALASTAVTLSTPTPNPTTIAHALIRYTTTSQNLSNQLAHINTLQQYLSTQQSLLRAQLNELRSNPAFSTPSSLPRQTNDQVRQTKHLRTKIREYEDKLSSLQSSQGKSSSARKGGDVSSAEAISDMLEQQGSLDELKDKVEALEAQVEEFAGLPADREAARKEVSRLEVELDAVRRKRDGLFAGLVDK